MGISILDNFDYRAGKPNFTRDLFATVEEMVAFPEMYLPSVFECNVTDTGDRYRYNVNNDVDPVTGKWRLVTGGTGGSVDGYTKGEVNTLLNKKIDKPETEGTVGQVLTVQEDGTNAYADVPTYDDTELRELIGDIPIGNLSYEIVETLPEVTSDEAKEHTLYMIKSGSDDTGYNQYIIVDGAYKKVGSTTGGAITGGAIIDDNTVSTTTVFSSNKISTEYAKINTIPVLTDIIDDTQTLTNKTNSSSKILTDIQKCLEDSKTYTLEELEKVKIDDTLTTTDKTITGAINEVNGNLLDTVGFSADYKNIILNRKNGLNPYTIPISTIINNASLVELKDVDSTDVGDGKTLVYDGTTNKHKYVDSSITDEFVKMDSTTDANYLSNLIDKSTVVNDNGVLKVKKLDGQEVTITEINYLKGLTMNIMDLVNVFSNGGVKVLNTPLNTASELDTMDRTSLIDGISYIVYVLADENHSGAKTTYLVDKTSTTFFGNADSQRNFTTNPIDLANEVTGKLDNSCIDVDSLWTLLTINDTYKTLTTKNEVFGTHGAKALYDELITYIGAKANAIDLTTHTNDTDIHVTTTDKAKWDKVTDKLDAVDFNTHKDNTDIHITNAERTKWDKVDGKVDKTDIVDNLTSTDTDKPLSANQGKILNDTKLNKTDANKLNCVTIDNVSIKEYILTNFTGTEKTYYLIAKTTCTDLPKASNFFITVETPGLYTYKVTAKELNDSNGSYVCTYRTISSSWTAWEKVLTGDITDTIDINSSGTKIPNVKAIYNDIIIGKDIDQTVIDTYGTEILKYPLGIWRFGTVSTANKFSDLPVKTGGRIEITSIKADTNSNPWNSSWAYRVYNFETFTGMNYFRKVTSTDKAGKNSDTGWQKVCTTTVADVSKTAIIFSDETNYKPHYTNGQNMCYEVKNGVCYVSYDIDTVSPTATGTFITINKLPISSLGYIHSYAFTYNNELTKKPLMIRLGTDGSLTICSGETGSRYLGSFSYPVAE